MGASSSTSFTESSIPNQTGRVIAITGGNIGLGFASAKQLLAAGATKVILLCRSQAKGEQAANELNALGYEGKAEFVELDLADLEQVAKCAAQLLKSEPRLDVLMLNAGVMVPPFGLTKQGFELQFGVNDLGHFALTLPLLPLLRKSREEARIVVVSSSAHRHARSAPDWSDICTRSKGYNAWGAYGDSKLCNLLFARALQSRLTAAGVQNVKVTTSHPGYTATNLQQTTVFGFLNVIAMAPEQGALTQVRAAVDSSLKPLDFIGPDGLFGMRGYPVLEEPSDLAKDDNLAEKFWSLVEEKTGIKLKL